MHYSKRGRTNLIGASLNNNLIATMSCDFSINANVFLSYVKEVLLKNIPKNSIVIMDNASIHKRQDIQDEIKNSGHILEFLPAYLPDLNPIEHIWGNMKAFRRKKNLSITDTISTYNLEKYDFIFSRNVWFYVNFDDVKNIQNKLVANTKKSTVIYTGIGEGFIYHSIIKNCGMSIFEKRA